MKDLPKILSGQEFQKHVQVEGDLRSVLNAPVTEILLTYFAASITEDEKAAISAKAQDIINTGLDACGDATAVSFGWSVEDDFPVFGSQGGERQVGTVLAVFVGWTSVDAAEKYWEENEHKKEFGEVVKIKEALEMVSRFVECRKFGERK